VKRVPESVAAINQPPQEGNEQVHLNEIEDESASQPGSTSGVDRLVVQALPEEKQVSPEPQQSETNSPAGDVLVNESTIELADDMFVKLNGSLHEIVE
jgi:hypothetical protein